MPPERTIKDKTTIARDAVDAVMVGFLRDRELLCVLLKETSDWMIFRLLSFSSRYKRQNKCVQSTRVINKSSKQRCVCCMSVE